MSSVEAHVDISTLKNHIDSKRFSVAILTWVFYEMLITMGDCITLFWMNDRWSVAKVLFFINRISVVLTITTINALNFVSFDSDNDCQIVNWAQFVGTFFIISIVAFTLASRIYALWKGYRIVLTMFFLVMSANLINYTAIYGAAIYNGTTVVRHFPFTGCSVVTHSNILWVMFANTLTFEAFSIVLIIIKAWPIARQRGIQTPIFSLLLEDGLAYYLAFTIAKLFTVGAIYVPTVVSFIVLPSYPAVPVAALAINRLFIRLQRVLVDRPVITDFTGADFSPANGVTGGKGKPKGVVTIGGSDPTGCMHARHSHQSDKIFFDRDVELYLAEVDTTSTRPGSIRTQPPAAESVTVTIASKPSQVV